MPGGRYARHSKTYYKSYNVCCVLQGRSKEQVKRSEVYGKWLERHGIEGKAPCYVGSCGEVGEKRIVVRG
jgi:hypothetical protein